jgi:hypothetical protein
LAGGVPPPDEDSLVGVTLEQLLVRATKRGADAIKIERLALYRIVTSLATVSNRAVTNAIRSLPDGIMDAGIVSWSFSDTLAGESAKGIARWCQEHEDAISSILAVPIVVKN